LQNVTNALLATSGNVSLCLVKLVGCYTAYQHLSVTVDCRDTECWWHEKTASAKRD